MLKNFLLQNQLLFKNTAKNAGIGLFFGLSVLLVSVLIASLLYQPKKMAKRGFAVEIKITEQTPDQVGGAKTGNDIRAKAAPADIATLLQTADIEAGAKTFKKCATCHTIEKGGANKVGPNLFAIVGKKRASYAGFNYSDAMKSKGGIWTIEDLNLWITKPKDFIPGNKMGFAGLKKDKDRANVIAYLKQKGK